MGFLGWPSDDSEAVRARVVEFLDFSAPSPLIPARLEPETPSEGGLDSFLAEFAFDV